MLPTEGAEKWGVGGKTCPQIGYVREQFFHHANRSDTSPLLNAYVGSGFGVHLKPDLKNLKHIKGKGLILKPEQSHRRIL
jgi:hypothetical protein